MNTLMIPLFNTAKDGAAQVFFWNFIDYSSDLSDTIFALST